MVAIAFIHPDLGIGGAEKAMIDAALALKSSGHTVEFVTSHHDHSHCFPETKDGNLNVTVAGDWIPRSLFGRFYALFAYIRMIYAAIYLVFFHKTTYDLIICDQISACIPVLRLSHKPIIFYCHFPDMLLTQRQSALKKLYRMPIDWLEEVTTGQADKVLVNSRFTAGVFHDTFQRLGHISPEVVYPIPNFKPLDLPAAPLDTKWKIPKFPCLFLSINRYERKKNLGLAIQSLAKLKNELGSLYGKAHLVMAGGYDSRVVENVEHHNELCKLAEELGVDNYVTFLRSVSDNDKRSLLAAAECLIYTPDKEHFGIVPVEAMYMRCPVIAVNSGGPMETVKDNVTGFLCEQSPEAFSQAMMKFIKEHSLKSQMGDECKKRMVDLFSYETYKKQLNSIVKKLAEEAAEK